MLIAAGAGGHRPGATPRLVHWAPAGRAQGGARLGGQRVGEQAPVTRGFADAPSSAEQETAGVATSIGGYARHLGCESVVEPPAHRPPDGGHADQMSTERR